MRTLETMMEERSWARRKRWKARVGYGEGFLETRSLGSSIRGNIIMLTSDCAVCATPLNAIEEDFSEEQTVWIYIKKKICAVRRSLSRTARAGTWQSLVLDSGS